MGILTSFLDVLKFPLKLLVGWKQKRPQKTELEKKQIKHVRNFAPIHYSWQKSIGRDKKKRKKRKLVKKLNHSKV